MLIGIDANEANLTQNRVGINEYAFNLLLAISNWQLENPAVHEFVIYLKTKPHKDLPKERNGWKYRVIPFPKLWTQTRLPFDLFFHSPRPDVFFSMTHYAPRFAPMPTVVAVMDLGFLQTPEQFTVKDFNQLKNWTEYSVRNAKRVIAISEYTKQDILKTFSKKPEDVVVTHLACSPEITGPVHDPKVLKKYGITKPYFLFLGSLKPNKNVEGLIRAFYELINTPSPSASPPKLGGDQEGVPVGVNLIIAGKKAWLYASIFELVRSLKLDDRVIFTGFVEESEKPVLLTESMAYILPSFMEGFGIPVLEAMVCGTPVVISKVASLPEVGGDAAIYIDPHDIKSIAQGIMEASGSKRSQWVKLGKERVKLFNWAKTAQETILCLQTATENH